MQELDKIVEKPAYCWFFFFYLFQILSRMFHYQLVTVAENGHSVDLLYK